MWWQNAALYHEKRFDDLNMSMKVDRESEVEMVSDIETSEPESEPESESEIDSSDFGSMPALESGAQTDDD
jgi:hypothetical protein